MIKKVGSKWILYSKDGTKKLGEFDTKKEAEDREKEINRIKHMKNKQFKAYTTSNNEDQSINIHEVEIFLLGHHKGFDYDQEWASKAIGNFNSQKEVGFYPSVVIGHNGGEDEKPARGFMDNLKLDGDIIKADIIKVPKGVFEDLKERKFPHRSVEVNPDDARFTGLALLGGTSPYHKLPIMEFGEDPDSVVIDFAAQKTTTVQTFIFNKETFKKAADARSWLKENDKKSGDVDETEDSFRFQQIDEDEFDKKSFRTIDITDGVQAVIGKLKKGSKFAEELDLEEAIELEEKLSKVRTIWYKMMDFIDRILFDKEKNESNKKSEIKNLLDQGVEILGTEIDNFKNGGPKMGNKIQFTEEELKGIRNQDREEFKSKHGMYPEEAIDKIKTFEENETKRQSEAHKKSITDFADTLKKEGMAPAIVDGQIVPFLESLKGNVTVKFTEEDKEVEKPQMDFFQSFVKNLLTAARENKLFVPLDEKTEGIKFEDIASEVEGQSYDPDKVHKKALVLMSEDPKLKYEEAINRIIKAVKK